MNLRLLSKKVTMSPITNSARNNGTALIELGKKASAYRAIDENVDQVIKYLFQVKFFKLKLKLKFDI